MRYPTRFLAPLFVLCLVAGCSSSDNEATDETPITTAGVTTTAARETTVPSTSQDVLLTFDGEQCTYEGPSEGVLSEPVSLELINNSDLQATGAVSWVPPDLLEEVMPTVGTDFPLSEKTAGLGFAFSVDAQPQSEASLTNVFVASPGTYVLECLSREGADFVQAWRPAAIEFSP